MRHALNELAERRLEELRADAALRRYAREHRVRRHRLRLIAGRGLVRLGERLAAAPIRTAATR